MFYCLFGNSLMYSIYQILGEETQGLGGGLLYWFFMVITKKPEIPDAKSWVIF